MFLKILYGVMGAGALGNGIYMLIAPETWFGQPGLGVEDTGPMNVHFIRDLGIVYAIVGIGLLWSMANLAQCRVVHIGVTLFMFGHAIEHVFDILTGHLPNSHWYVDAAGVFAPGIVFFVIALPPVWARLNPEAT